MTRLPEIRVHGAAPGHWRRKRVPPGNLVATFRVLNRRAPRLAFGREKTKNMGQEIWCALYHDEMYLSANETLELASSVPGVDVHVDAPAMDELAGLDANWTLDSLYSGENLAYRRIEEILYSRVIVALGVFGLLGNIVNLFVLTRRSLLSTLSRMEKFACSGLVALATSDLFFCVAVLPLAVVDLHRHIFTSRSLALYYVVYNNAVINVCITFSTWLTVTLAVGRYYAICSPMRARQMTGLTTARWAIAILMINCLVFNSPRFWFDVIEEVPCPNGEPIYFRERNLRDRKTFYLIYTWSYFVLAIFLPLIVLTYCNMYLIRALRRSSSGRSGSTLMREGAPTAHAQAQARSSTLTLIILVLMFTFFVCPGEIANFARETVLADVHMTDSYNMAIAVVNTLQTINFSFNFVLYSAINVHFRRTMREYFFGSCFDTTMQSATTLRHEHVTMQTMLSRNGSSSTSVQLHGNGRQCLNHASARRPLLKSKFLPEEPGIQAI